MITIEAIAEVPETVTIDRNTYTELLEKLTLLNVVTLLLKEDSYSSVEAARVILGISNENAR